MISFWKQVALSYVQSFLFSLLCATRLESSLSWEKTVGGDVFTWVVFELLHRTYQLGKSERRSEWFIRQTRQVAQSSTVNIPPSEEGLGRVM